MTLDRHLVALCAHHRKLAVVGTAKNAGKTTTFNFLVEHLHRRGETLGLTAIGLDGDVSNDEFRSQKPYLCPPVGTLVATSIGDTFGSRNALVKIAETPFRNALGPVSIYRVAQLDFVTLAGPARAHELGQLMRLMNGLGCTRILVDGAADRKAFLSEDFDGFILAVGSPDGDATGHELEDTLSALTRLQLPEAPEPFRQPGELASRAGALTPTGFVPWLADSFLIDSDRFAEWLPDDAVGIVIPGALTNRLAQIILSRSRPLALVVPDGTHLLCDTDLLQQLTLQGCRTFAQRPLNAVAVTLNPTSLRDGGIDPHEFLGEVHRTFPQLPVFDVQHSA